MEELKMKQVTEEVIEAVTNLRDIGWSTAHLLNVSEFIDVFFDNANVHLKGDDGDIIANYLAEDDYEENIVTYAAYVLSGN
jgi:hypothetical protein